MGLSSMRHPSTHQMPSANKSMLYPVSHPPHLLPRLWSVYLIYFNIQLCNTDLTVPKIQSFIFRSFQPCLFCLLCDYLFWFLALFSWLYSILSLWFCVSTLHLATCLIAPSFRVHVWVPDVRSKLTNQLIFTDEAVLSSTLNPPPPSWCTQSHLRAQPLACTVSVVVLWFH